VRRPPCWRGTMIQTVHLAHRWAVIFAAACPIRMPE
jgi:hypothetical protein